jgi:hypothetical protein
MAFPSLMSHDTRASEGSGPCSRLLRPYLPTSFDPQQSPLVIVIPALPRFHVQPKQAFDTPYHGRAA